MAKAVRFEEEVAQALGGLPHLSEPSPRPRRREVAVLIPCHDEAATVAGVVRGFAAALPGATIYVYDNASKDDTVARAEEAGAVVRREPRRGKGQVVRRMFRDVEAEVYVLVDGDLTYEADAAPRMVERLVGENLDLVTGERIGGGEAAYRTGHRFGNRALTGAIRLLFGADTRDMLSGYRVMSRRFVKSFPTASTGFEIETELTVHALEIGAPVLEVPTAYAERPDGSASKLNTLRDGFRIATMIARLLQRERPLQVFGAIGAAAFVIGAVLAAPILATYFATGLVPRLPSLVAAATLGLFGTLSVFAGAILGNLAEARREVKRLFYLQLGGPGGA